MHYRAPRLPADHIVHIETRQGSTHVTLRNISSQGVCFAGDLALRRGEPIRITLGGQPNDAKIMWARAGLFGVRLAKPLSEDALYRARNLAVRGPGHGVQQHWSTSPSRFREL